MVKGKWRVIIHTNLFYKVTHVVGSREMALEYAERILTHGDYYTDERGVITFLPIAQIFKVKVIPPDVELDKTETEVS